jgi:hypothetical protein
MENGRKVKPSSHCVPNETKREDNRLLQIQQGNSSSLLFLLEGTNSLIESGQLTLSRLPLDVILSALRLVEGYIESVHGVSLVTLERTRFLKLYGRMGKFLLETRPKCRSTTTVPEEEAGTASTSQHRSFIGSPDGLSLEAELENLEKSESTKASNPTADPPEGQRRSSTTSLDSDPGTSTTPAAENGPKLERSGSVAESTSDPNLLANTAKRFMTRLNESVLKPLSAKAVEKVVSSWFTEDSGRFISVEPSFVMTDRTWRSIEVEDSEDEEDIPGDDASVSSTDKKEKKKKKVKRKIWILDEDRNLLPNVGGASARNNGDGYDDNDKRPFKVIEIDPKNYKHDIRYVDCELYYHLRKELFGKPVHTQSIDSLKMVANRYLNTYKMSHLDGFAVDRMIRETVYAALIPEDRDLKMISSLARNKKTIDQVSTFNRDGYTTKKRFGGFLPFVPNKKVQVFNKA